MIIEEELWKLEERLWLGGSEAARTILANDAVLILPYPKGIAQGVDALDDAPWASRWRTVRMDDKVFSLQDNVAVLGYRVSGERPDIPIYRALCASSYIKDNETWKLVSHQQTPLGQEDLAKPEL